MKSLSVLLFCLSLSSGAGLQAATISIATASMSSPAPCADSQIIENGTASAGCAETLGNRGNGFAFAEASAGVIRGGAFVGILNGQENQSSFLARADFGASFQDTLNFSIVSGTFLLPVDVLGLSSFSTGGGTSNDGRAQFGYGATVVSQTVYDSSDIGTNKVTSVALSIVNSRVLFSVSTSGFVSCVGGAFTGGALDTSCESGVDFGNSLRLLGGTVYDDSGAVVVGGFVASDSGFNYSVGVKPHAVSAVPLPNSLLLMLLVLTLILVVRVRWIRLFNIGCSHPLSLALRPS